MENLDFSIAKNSKNLLAFSAGVDSTALFFLLLKENISFDIAIVNYNLREQSEEEISYAKKLAKKYDKKIFVKEVDLKNSSNMEKKARDIRYTFFEQIISENSYDTLITAHQLNDKLEWFFMQLSKGAGFFELMGLSKLEQRENYKIFKPLLQISKSQLQEFLDSENIKYFVDESNFDEKYKRNYFRHNFSDKFLKEFQNGVKNSFEYLQKDLNSLSTKIKLKLKIKELEIFENTQDENLNLRIIDKSLKKRGILISSAQREEIIKQNNITISHKINISIDENYIYICPVKEVTIDKKFKEKCRINKIPNNIRAYLFKENINPEILDF